MILLGNKIKELRKKNKFTQTELAEKVGVTKSTIAAYENDTRTPSYDVLIKMSDVFKVTLDYLILERKDDRNIDVSKLTTSQIFTIKDMVRCFENDNRNLANCGYVFNENYLNETFKNKKLNNDNKK